MKQSRQPDGCLLCLVEAAGFEVTHHLPFLLIFQGITDITLSFFRSNTPNHTPNTDKKAEKV
jgi:hypothetical protein